MAEVITEMIVPGTYIEVKDEALIRAGAVSVGNVGILGTADKGPNYTVEILSSFSDAKDKLGESGSLVKGLELVFSNGARNVYAVKIENDNIPSYANGLDNLLNRNVHIIVTPGAEASAIATTLNAHCEVAENNGRDRIGILGSSTIGSVPENDRLVYVVPGIKVFDRAEGKIVDLPGSYAACAVAGLIASLPSHHSPTNKNISVEGVTREYTYSEIQECIKRRVLVLERKNGSVKVVKGITTDKGAWKQITTRRIVDYAKAGVRQGANPYIGRLNNDRVRKALKATLDGFLSGMKQNEMLTEYSLEVTATRDDEIEGRCIVTTTLKPTFSIDYIRVIMYLG
jgi:hypothetical protein